MRWSFAFLLSLSGCIDGDFFYIENDGAVMPVWVRGAIDSGTLALILHGGPGTGALDFRWFLEPVESRYGVVYWDQRASGSAQGNPDPTTLTLEQFVEDTELLVDVLEDRYRPDDLFLVGQSWGGTLGVGYLTKGDNQERITGWIEMDGAHDMAGGLAYSKEWARGRAREELAAGEREGYWEEALDWYDTDPPIDNDHVDNLWTHADYVTEARGYILDEDYHQPGGLADAFASPMSTFAVLSNSTYTVTQAPVWELDLSDDLAGLTIPSLVIWGRHDGIMPVQLAQETYDDLGTDPEAKSVVLFEDSAHFPLGEENAACVAEIMDFIGTWR